MAVPKKYMKQAKAAMKSASKSKDSRKPARKKKKVIWNFKMGDLVEYNGDCYFIVDDSRGDAWFELMTADGRKWVKARELKKIQTLPADATPHANDKQSKV